VAHDEPVFAAALAESLATAGYEVTVFRNPKNALFAMEAAENVVAIDVLITRFRFGSPRIIGLSLARAAKVTHPGIAVLFIAQPEFRDAAMFEGKFIAAPAKVEDVVKLVAVLVEP
jgi:DNA-binding NtrC family response regulator